MWPIVERPPPWFGTLMSALSLFVIVLVGLVYIPHDVLFAFEKYEDAAIVLRAMSSRIQNNTLFTLAVWLFPIPLAVALPLRITEVVLVPFALVTGAVMFLSLFLMEERIRFVHMLQTFPEAGYMWYEVVVISASCFVAAPTNFVVLWGGPMACVCAGPSTTRKNPRIFSTIALLSVVFILPTMKRFVNEENELFLLGYTTKSVAGRLLSVGMILVWTRCYHLVCRGAYAAYTRPTAGTRIKVLCLVWILFGTALVEVWVSAAWAMHLAFSSVVGLSPESSFFWKLNAPSS